MEKDKEYVIKKLGLNREEFDTIWNKLNKTFLDYPSYYPLIKKFLKIVKPLFRYLLPARPMIFFEMDEREYEKK